MHRVTRRCHARQSVTVDRGPSSHSTRRAEAAQIVILDSRLTAIPEVIAFARKTVRRVEFNIMAFAVGVNAAAIIAAGTGYLTPAG